MPGTIADLRAKVSVDGADKAKKDLQGLHGNMSSLGESFKKGLGLVAGFAGGFLALNAAKDVLGFVGGQLKDIIDQGNAAETVMAQTAQVIKSTGGAAGISADEVGNLAGRLSLLTGISDNNVQAVTNVLLTFTNLKKDVLPQTTELVLDLSHAMHEDLNSAAIQIGKALQDPIQGVTALRRVGVQLSKQQEDAVKHFVAVGNIAGAQKIIMKELTREVGGSAEAYGKTFPGQMLRFQQSLDQAKEKIGLAILPILSDMLQKYVMPLADWVGQHLPAAIQVLTTFLTTRLEPAISDLMNSPFVQTLEGWANTIFGQVVPAVDSHKGLTGATNTAKSTLKSLSGQIHTTGTDLDPTYTKHINAAINKTYGLADAIDPKGSGDTSSHALVPAMRRADAELDALTTSQQKNQDQIPGWERAITGAATSWDTLDTHVHQVITTLGEFKDAVASRFAAAQPAMIGILLGMSNNLVKWGHGLKGNWSGIWDSLTGLVKVPLHTIEGLFVLTLDTLRGLTTGKWEQLRRDWLHILGQIMQDVLQFVRGIQRTLSGLPSWLQGAGGGIKFPGHAGGGYIAQSQLSWVGERGPELMALPAGSTIYSHTQSMAMARNSGGMGGHGVTVNNYIYGADYNSTAAIGREVERRISRKMALYG